MVKITKVYTRSGDTGQTGLVGGSRLEKNHPRIEAYGCVDELNSIVGIVRSFLAQEKSSIRRDKLDLILEAIQQKLFDMGSEMATPAGAGYEGQIFLLAEDTEWLEEIIDLMNEELEVLSSFILPGGTAPTAFIHQARTVCRRAERNAISLNDVEFVSPEVIKYLNRLSDFFFVAGRWVTDTLGKEEILWKPGKGRPDWNWKSAEAKS